MTKPTQPKKDPFLNTNLFRRVASGVPALILVLALLLWGSYWMIGIAALVLGVYGIKEYQTMLAAKPCLVIPRLPFLIAAGLVGVGQVWGGEFNWFFLLFFFVAIHVVFTSIYLTQKDRSLVPRQWALAGGGLLLIPGSLNVLALIHHRTDGPWPGSAALIFLVVALSLNDTLAYFTGRLIGRRLLMPSVSPKKTVEGSLGGLAGGAMAGWLYTLLWTSPQGPMGMWEPVVVGVVLAVLGQMGDLLESKIKRECGVKDSGEFLPGHGGLLDRVDAYLLAAPTFYAYLLLTPGG